MKRRDESGAIAVIVAVLAVSMIGLCAFVVDHGLAYANKRQMQTAADAGALGAAGVFGTQPGGDCDSILAAGDVAAKAEAVAKETSNGPTIGTSDLTAVTATCDADELIVRTTVGGESPKIFGGGDDYGLVRSAAAVVEPATSVGAGLRPLMVCSKDLTIITASFPSPVVKLGFPEDGYASAVCPDVDRAGNWWTLDCPEDNGNDLAYNLEHGCEDPVTIVPGQPATDPGLRSHLLAYCPNSTTHPESCLRSKPGVVRENSADQAFSALVASAETFFLPVFCGPPTCTPGAVSDDGGSNVIYPVHKLIAVQLCGYHFGPKKSARSDMVGDCADTPTNNPSGYDPADGGSHANYLLAVVKQVQVSGSVTPSGCKFGDPCDTGLRQVRMVNGGFGY